MDKQNNIKRGNMPQSITTPVVEDFSPVNAAYNIPQEYMQEQTPQKQYSDNSPLSSEKIANSKLPEEIKRLMIENPIEKPNMSGPTISEDVIAGAQRLMNMGKTTTTQPSRNEMVTEEYQSSNVKISEIKNILRDVVRDTVRDVVREELKDAGMLVESTKNSNEVIQFKVGQHLFVGRVTKIKKLQG
jgi:hypothetical protein